MRKSRDGIRPMHIETQEVVVTGQIPSGSAFGVTGSGEQVFIPPQLANELHVGDHLEAMMIPNNWNHKDRTPWRIVRFTLLDGGEVAVVKPDPVQRSLRQQVLDVLEEDPDVQWSVNDIKDALGMDVGHQDILQECEGLWAVGSVVKAQVYGSYNKKASFNLYSKSIDAFK